MKSLVITIALLSNLVFGQTYLVDQHFSASAPSGWSSTSNVWNFARNESATMNYRNVFDATTYSARFSSAANGNSIFIYIPINFISGNTYTITFYTKRACSVTINTNELPNQTTLLSTETQTNSGCNSNWNTWYQWSTTILSSYTGSGYFQIWTKTIYGGPTSVYLDDLSIYESEPVNLPIELIYFRGINEGDANKLIWSTASENNNDYFTIEKTVDGKDFQIVSNIDGAGNSSNIINYQYVDRTFEHIINYYRLKQTDFDGKYDYSDIISIDNRESDRSISLLKIVDLMGREVDEKYKGMVILIYSDRSTKLTIQN